VLNVFFDHYLSYCRLLSLSENSIKGLLRYIRQLENFLFTHGSDQLSNLQYKHLAAFAISNKAGPNTVKARIWAMKKFFAFLQITGHFKVNIAEGLNPPKIPKKETRFLSGPELKVIFDDLAENINKTNGLRDLLIIVLMAVCGFRKSSVAALDLEHFDRIGMQLFVTEKGSPSLRPIQVPRAVFVLIREHIYRCDIKNGALFINRKEKRLHADGINKIVDQLKNRLIEKGCDFAAMLHPHIFRHSAATQLNEVAGFSITKEMLGHRNAQNTRKYIHLSPTCYGEYMKRHPWFKHNQKEIIYHEQP
jgi:site-specific recombinase XerD